MAALKKKLSYTPAPIPKNEEVRLESVYKLGVLETEPEERFDRITRLALNLFKVPMSTISIIDSSREWFKSCQGLRAREGERAISFCGHAMLASDILIIPDTKKDSRFRNNPMVVRKPYVRFYAGVPLKAADGQRIGTFCIKDRRPRRLNKENQKILKYLASWVEIELNAYELGQAIDARRKAEEKVLKLNKILRLLNKILRHDILNNLTVIKISLELLKGTEKRPVKIAIAAINRSEKLITQIKELETAVSSGENLLPYRVGKVLKEISERFADMKFSLRGDGVVLADEALISVFENLIGNAQIHGKADKITISIKDNKENVIIRLADNGKGIPAIIKKNLFKEGYKYGKTGHSGLGLYIVKNTIDRYGGEISIENNRTKGTSFMIKLKKAKKNFPKNNKAIY